MASLSFKSVGKTYPGPVEAVRSFSLDVADGEFLVLVGPSGCGKSTLLRMVAGLEAITTGEIFIGTRLVNRVPPRDRDIAMVFQNYALYPHMTVEKNLSFGLRMRKVPRETIERKVRETAAMLGIAELLGRRPSALSGGQQQRVAVGRAIVREPACFLFDEPLSNLDARLRIEMRAELKALHQRLRTTTLYVTHDQEEAMTLGERVVVLCEGRVQQVGRPLEIYRRPANAFVAGFVGSPPINLVAGRLESNGAGSIFDDGSGVRCVVTPAAAARAGEVVLGIRPEALVPVAGPDVGDLAATVGVCEPVGDRMDVRVATAGGTELVARIPATDDIQPGQTVHFTLDRAAVHVFAPGRFGARL